MTTVDEIWPPGTAEQLMAGFDADRFKALIQQRGGRFRWYRAVECPCGMGERDQYSPICPRCAGDGFFYVSPRHKWDRENTETWVSLHGVISTVKLDPSVKEVPGDWDFGDALLTVQTEQRVAYFDRFEALEQEMAFTQLLRRPTDEPAYGAPENFAIPVGFVGRTAEDRETAMRYEPVEIEWVGYEESNGTVTVYYEAIDFLMLEATLTEPQRMAWLDGKGPPAGARFAVHYIGRPVWVVTDGQYAVQTTQGRVKGLKGKIEPMQLPTTFKVRLDWLTRQRGT